MSVLPVISGKKVIKALLKMGFFIDHQKGSHVRLINKLNPEIRLTSPTTSKDLPKPTLKSIIRQAEITVDELKSNL